MKKNSNLKNILTKDYKYENYILLVLSIIGIALSILLITKTVKLEVDNMDPNVFALVMGSLSIFALILSIFKIKKEKKISKLSVYKDIVDLANNALLENKFKSLGIEYSIETDYTKSMKSFCVIAMINDSIDAYLWLRQEEYNLSFDYNPANNMADIVSEEDDELIANIDLTYQITEDMTAEKVISKFKLFIEENEELVNNIYNKYKDKLVFEEINEN